MLIPFLDELEELEGRTVLKAWTDWNTPRLLLLFTDRTAAVIVEDRSSCYYAGEYGGMMATEPYDDERKQALELWESVHA